MRNHNKHDKVSVNIITPDNEIKSVSGKIGSAADVPNCIYAHEKHAAGSRLINKDGTEAVCTEDGTWENKNHNQKI